MDEEKKQESEEEESKEEETTKEDEKKAEETSTPMIDQAKEVAERIEKATEAQRKENDRSEKLIAENALSGKSTPGVETKPEEPSDQDYAEKVLNGNLNAKD